MFRDSTVTSTVDRVVTHESFVGYIVTPSIAHSGGLAGGGGLGAVFSNHKCRNALGKRIIPGTVTDVTGFDSLASGVDVSDFRRRKYIWSLADDAAASLSGLKVFDEHLTQATEIQQI